MSDNSKFIWDFLLDKIGNEYGVSGLMGNLYAESGLKPNNLQNTSNRSLGMTDEEYTRAIDEGKITKDEFVNHHSGYGLAQWTYHTRKKSMYEYIVGKYPSIGDLQGGLDFLCHELSRSYKSVWNTLKNAKSVLEASNAVLLKYERPADQSEKVQNKRASYGQVYYDKYAVGIKEDIKTEPKPEVKPDKIKVDYAMSKNPAYSNFYTTTNDLNLRTGAGTNKDVITVIPKGSKVRCYGYYTHNKGTTWLLVLYGSQEGFCSMKYLRK